MNIDLDIINLPLIDIEIGLIDRPTIIEIGDIKLIGG